MTRRAGLVLAVALSAGLAWPLAHAEDETADAFIKRVSTETLDQVKADKTLRNGDSAKIMQMVDNKLMPHVNFRRMTALATGPAWRKATPDQYFHDDPSRYGITALRLTDLRADLLKADETVKQAALDPYSFVRDGWLQKREYDVYDGNPPSDFDYSDPDAAP